MRIVTLKERKARATAAKVAAVEQVRRELAGVAEALHGRFWLFGSAARGTLRYDSDIDLLLDFPDAASTTAAWRAAEEACGRAALEYDIHPIDTLRDDLRSHVMRDAKPIP